MSRGIERLSRFKDATRPALAAPFLRIGARALRGGLSGFRIFLACVALGVAAIAGVGSVSHGFSDGIARQGRVILGGDASFSLMHVQLTPAERSWLAARGSVSSVSSVALLRAMARTANGAPALIDLKAVNADWPTQGAAVVAPDQPLSNLLAPKNGVDGLIADAALGARLNLSLGDRVRIGAQTFALRGTLLSEPDSLAGGLTLGPRVIITQAALGQTGLLQPGALVRWVYRVTLPGDAARPPTDADVARFVQAANAAFPSAGWETRTRDDVSPQFARSLAQLTQFLTLVGLTALIVGGVGVANAVRAFVDRKSDEFAIFKSLGATGHSVFILSLAQVAVFAALGVGIGLVVGASVPFIVAWGFGTLIPIPFSPSVYPGELALAALYGFLVAFVFSILPLGRAHDAPVAALFRERIEPDRTWPRPRYLVMVALAAAALIAAIVLFASDRRIAAFYVATAAAAFALLRVVASTIMLAARRAPRPRAVEARLAVANIHRPGALTPSVVLSLGIGLTLLVALALIEGNLRHEIGVSAPGQTPSLFFLDVPSAETGAFRDFVHARAPSAKLEEVPMLRGRVTRLNGRPPEDAKIRDETAWVLEGDRGVTYSDAPPVGSKVVAGTWWPKAYSGPPLVSMDAQIARGLGLKLGDTITLNVLGRDVTARIANLREVDWRTFGVNFVFVFSPNAFVGAPHTTLAAAIFPDGDAAQRDLTLLRDTSNAFPMITVVRVKDAFDAVNRLLDKVMLAIRGASSVALASAAIVLAGALASGQRNRIYDAVVLKTLGATRARLVIALLIEFALLGGAAAIFGVAAGGVAAYVVLIDVMKVDSFVWLWGPACGAALLALGVAVIFGLVGTYRALGQRPGSYLRAQ